MGGRGEDRGQRGDRHAQPSHAEVLTPPRLISADRLGLQDRSANSSSGLASTAADSSSSLEITLRPLPATRKAALPLPRAQRMCWGCTPPVRRLVCDLPDRPKPSVRGMCKSLAPHTHTTSLENGPLIVDIVVLRSRCGADDPRRCRDGVSSMMRSDRFQGAGLRRETGRVPHRAPCG